MLSTGTQTSIDTDSVPLTIGELYLPVRLYVLIAGICLCVLCTGCSTVRHDDRFFGRDKLYHFTIAGAIGAGTTVSADCRGTSRADAPIIGTSVALGFGAGKELYDLKIKKTFWSWKDMLWDLIGGLAGSYVVHELTETYE